MERLISLAGLIAMVVLAFLFSNNKRKIRWKIVVTGLILQAAFGFLILKTGPGMMIFQGAKSFFIALMSYSDQGAKFIFGSLAEDKQVGFVIFTMVLPTIIFFSALMQILYHLGVVQLVVKIMAWLMVRVMGTSGAESLATAANIFVGQTEAPLVIKPFVQKMTRSELMALMTGGMATVAGGVFAVYVGMGIDGGHLLAASVMSAPAALVCAKLMVPETENSTTEGKVKISLPKDTTNLIDAAAVGAIDGLKLAMNVGAMILAFVAILALINGGLGWMGGLLGYPKLSMEFIMGYVFSPLAFLTGIPWTEANTVGSLLGKKLIFNEFVAYLDLKELIQLKMLSERSVVITTYALCGFANFGSIAIQVGGIGTIAPGRRKDLALLGIRSLIGGTLACLMTACIAGMLIDP